MDTKKETEIFIGATESRLLQAMSIDDANTEEIPAKLPEFIAYAGNKLEDTEIKAKMHDIIEGIRTVYAAPSLTA